MRLKHLMIGIVAINLMLLPFFTLAKTWTPKGSIVLQVGFGAGGSTDIMGRLIATTVEENTGWNIVVENKPGGGGVAMLSGLMHRKPNGKTLGLAVNVPILLNLVKRGDKLPFKITSFDYIGTITKGENAVVAKADAPFNDLNSLLAFAKTKKISVAYDALPQHMVMKAVSKQSGLKFRLVKHKSGAEQIQSLLGGHVDVGCLAGSHIKYIKSGDFKMIAVYNKQRHGYAPETKTLIENGYNYYIDPYYYLVAPKGLPDNVRSTLVKAFNDAINSAKVKTALYNTLKATPHNLGPKGTQQMLTSGVKDIKRIITAGN